MVRGLPWRPCSRVRSKRIGRLQGYGTRPTELDIARLGSSLTSQNRSGVCRDLTRQEVERDEALRRKTFRCGDFTYVLEPAGSTIRGELTVAVDERIRQRGTCLRYRGTGPAQCTVYRWDVNSRRTQKRAQLTVSTMGASTTTVDLMQILLHGDTLPGRCPPGTIPPGCRPA